MRTLANWCARHRRAVLGSWVVLVVVLGGALGAAGGPRFSDSTRLPASDSSTAYGLLAKAGNDSASAKTGTIVWHVEHGSAVSGAAKSRMTGVLARISRVDGVRSVMSPFTSAGTAQISADHHTAYAAVVFASTSHKDQAKDIADSASTSSLRVLTGGTEFTNQTPSEASEGVGILAALLVLLLVFGSLWAALLPILTGVTGVIASSIGVMLLSHALTISSVAPSMGALIGLGVGIDYALLIVNRHLKGLRAGESLHDAIATAIDTSGRAVLFAGATVMVALLGMLILGVQFLTGMALGAALTVLLTVLSAVTLLPALLSKLGPRVLRRSERRAWSHGRVAQSPQTPRAADEASGGVWARWAALVQRRPVATSLVAIAAMIAIASPVVSMRLGSADASSDPTGTSTRAFYNTMASAFGDGYNAPLLLVATTPDTRARVAWHWLTTQLPRVDDVASVGHATTVGGDGTSVVQVIPKTAAQDQATSSLVTHLRSDLIKHAEAGSELRVHVGGPTATSIDFANALTSKLPLYLVIIAALGFLLLMLAFRSLLIPAIGALSNLLTIGVALGATVAVFQWGWGPSAMGIGGQAPVEYIVAMLIVGVIFGLSMDYQVFLVSRMREEWVHTHDNDRAITAGVAHTGRIIATAAAIMFCVFASFGFAGLRTASEFGVGLAIAVAADALLMRMTVFPAIMRACGARNWTIPAWLDRILPRISVEGPNPRESPAHVVEPTLELDPVRAV